MSQPTAPTPAPPAAHDADAGLLPVELALREGRLGDVLALTASGADRLADAPIEARRRWHLARLQALYRTGALQQVVEQGRELLPLLREEPASPALFDVLRWMSAAGAETGQYSTALLCAHECHALAQAGSHLGRQSMALNAIACCLERMGDPWQAERLMLEAIALVRDTEHRAELFIALNNRCALLIGRFHLLRDARTLADAREPLELALPVIREALELTRDMTDVFPRVFVEGNLGEVLTHLGRLDEAEGHLRAALQAAQAQGFEAQGCRISCTIGELELARGQAAQAWDTLSAVLPRADGAELRATRLRLHHALSKAAELLGRPQQALEQLQAYLRLERSRAVAQLHAQSELFVTRLEAEQERLEAQRQRHRAAELEADARRDPLTGVGNRRELELRLPQLLTDAQRQEAPLAFAMLDLDHFKQVNDQFGHAVGDQVLETLGRLLREATRAPDIVTRIGGEEFLVVFAGMDARAAQEAGERLRRMAEGHAWGALAPGLRVTVSIGLATTPPYDERELLAAADRALYRAKAEGRNRVVG